MKKRNEKHKNTFCKGKVKIMNHIYVTEKKKKNE